MKASAAELINIKYCTSTSKCKYIVDVANDSFEIADHGDPRGHQRSISVVSACIQ